MHESWKPSFLFLATPEVFYFDKVSTIIQNGGVMGKLSYPQITDALQEKYLELLNQFIVPADYVDASDLASEGVGDKKTQMPCM